MHPALDADPNTLTFGAKQRFHYIEGHAHFPDGWYLDVRYSVGGIEDPNTMRYGPIPAERLEEFVREHQSLLTRNIEGVLAVLRREVKVDGR